MTIRVLDGFDRYNGISGNGSITARWGVVAAVPTGNNVLSLTTGRFGGQALRFSCGIAINDSTAQTSNSIGIGVTGDPAFAAGFAVRGNPFATNATTGGAQIGVAGDGYDVVITDAVGNPHIGLRFLLTGAIQVNRMAAGSFNQAASGGTQLGITSAGVLLNNSWHFVEIEGVISDSAGFINIFVDGVSRLATATNIDTRNGGVAEAAQFYFNARRGASTFQVATHQIDYDDVYIRTGSSTRLGEGRVQTLVPNADTATRQFTPSSGSTNFNLLAEATYNTVDFVSSATLGHTDIYDFTDLVGTPASIIAVAVTMLANKTDGAARSVAARVISGGSATDGPDFPLTASPTVFQRIMPLNPDGNVAWTFASVNALRAGPKVTV